MKTIIKISFCLVLLLGIAGCTDGFEEKNSDPNKVYDVDLQRIFPGTVLKTMNFIAEANYRCLMQYSNYVTLQSQNNTAIVQDETDLYYRSCYVGIIRDLQAAEEMYAEKPEFANHSAIIKTWKAYVYYVMVSMYGGIPMSDAILTDDNKVSYRYDTEEQVYTQILGLLQTASEDLFNPSATSDVLKNDPVFGGASPIEKWRKFANTLRLDIALNVQNLSPALAETHVRAAMSHPDWIITSIDEMMQLSWGNNLTMDVSWYYNRLLYNMSATTFSKSTYPGLSEYLAIYLFSLNDPRITAYAEPANALNPTPAVNLPIVIDDTITRPNPSIVGKRDSIAILYSPPYVPMPQQPLLATGWEAALVPGSSSSHYTDPYSGVGVYGYSYLHTNFLKTDAKIVLLNWADACFLQAEALIKYPDIASSKTAKVHYEDGIRASFAQYGLTPFVNTYLNQDGAKWNTSMNGFYERFGLYQAKIEAGLDQIYKQRYIAGFMNCVSGWNLERRTRSFRFLPFFAANYPSVIQGASNVYNYIERLVYPLNEKTKNNIEYAKAVQNLASVSLHYDAVNRWGDNIFSSLGIAKVNPDWATAAGRFTGNLQIVYDISYLRKRCGETYEEMLAYAKALYPNETDANALVKACNFTLVNVISTY